MPASGDISVIYRIFIAGSIGGGDSVAIACRLRNAAGTEDTITDTLGYPIAVGPYPQIMFRSSGAGTARAQITITPSGFIATASARLVILKRFK